jgi:Concanavalin A-like lectin/glucanases superfamily
MRHRIFFKSLLILVLAVTINCAFAATWYVRPNGGSYGTENGTSYANAWDGFSNIVWGTNGVVAGDTLYICGAHLDTYLDVGASGSEGALITIRGDYSNDPGSIDASTDMLLTTSDWLEYDTNIWYYRWYSDFTPAQYHNGLYLNGKWAIQTRGWDGYEDLENNGDWAASSNGWIYIYAPSNPATFFSSIRHARNYYCISVDDCSYVTICNIKLMGSGSKYHIEEQDKSGAVIIKNSSFVTVANCDIHHTSAGIRLVEGDNSNCIVEYNNITEFQQLYNDPFDYHGYGIRIRGNNHKIRYNFVKGGLDTYNRGTVEHSGLGIIGRIYDADGNDGCKNLIIHNNEVSYVKGYGINISDCDYVTVNYDTNIKIFNNYVHDGFFSESAGTYDHDAISTGCAESTPTNSPLKGVKVYNNYIANFANSAIQMCNEWTGYEIYNNIIVECGSDIYGWGAIRAGNSGKVISNTIINTTGTGIWFDSGQGSTIANNIIYNVDKRTDGKVGYGIYANNNDTIYNNNISGAEGSDVACMWGFTITRSNPVNGYPQFVDYTNGNYKLRLTSPCIDSGKIVDILVDFDHRTINKPDVGCYESQYDSLVCWLHLDENTGTSTSDETIYENDGTLVGTPTWGIGIKGAALEFNASWGEYINCGNNDSINGLENYTISCWVKLDSSSSGTNRNIISKYDGTEPEGFLLRMGSDDSITFDQVSDGAFWNAALHVESDFPQDDEFHHVAVTFEYDGTDCTAKLYIDGELMDAETDECTPDISTSISSLQMGTGVFDGVIDEFKVYSKTLISKEIIACRDMASGKLDCFLKLDENTGTTAYDETSNDNDGILLGSPDWISGLLGSGLGFNASWSEYINCGNDDSLNNVSNYSISCWVKLAPSSSGTNRNILAKYNATEPEGFLLRMGSDDSIKFEQVSNGALWNANLSVVADFPQDDEFHHIAATFEYDGTDCTSKLYIDGELMDTGTDECTPDISTSISSLQMGTGLFDGELDEMKVYSKVLTGTEIWFQSRL